MTAYTVDLGSIADLTAQMEAFGRSLLRAHDDIEAGLSALQAEWSGAAADEQDLAQRTWSSGAAELTGALAVLRAIAGTAGENYAAAAGAGRRMWG